jgi:hypothetical protein
LRAGGRRGRGAEEQVAENLPDRLIEGLLASGIRRTTTIARGAIGNDRPIRIVSEEWRSRELQAIVMTDHSDPRTGHSTYRLFTIRRREQDPVLFQVPADYTIQVSGDGAAAATGAVGGRSRGR